MNFRALVTERDNAGVVSSTVRQLEEADLPAGDVTVDIAWSGVNYKDGLCLTGGGGLVRTYPHIAGIDFSGTVRSSSDPRYQEGQPVVLTGWRVGEVHWGGFSQRARVKGDWLVPLPEGLSLRDAMVLGTAGLTAMLAINRLEAAGAVPGDGDVLVTGGAGGVGSHAISLLARLGYSVTALSGRPERESGLRQLGATAFLARDLFMGEPDKPLESGRWAAAIDNVGGPILGKLLRQMRYGGAVASVGNAGGIVLETNVLPFILRAVTLVGIDSVMQGAEARIAAWQRLVSLFEPDRYSALVEEIGLEALPDAATRILAGQVSGRLIVRPA
jgi:acrylyl-CoA reductase (NADPH)